VTELDRRLLPYYVVLLLIMAALVLTVPEEPTPMQSVLYLVFGVLCTIALVVLVVFHGYFHYNPTLRCLHLVQQGRFEEARDLGMMVLRKNPRHVKVAVNTALACIALRDSVTARQVLDLVKDEPMAGPVKDLYQALRRQC
jgi:hypothetical protein